MFQEPKNKVFLVQGPSGCGKTHLIKTQYNNVLEPKEISYYDASDCDWDSFFFNLTSQSFFCKKKFVVLEGLEAIEGTKPYQKLVHWCNNVRINGKLKQHFRPITHNTLILASRDVYFKTIPHVDQIYKLQLPTDIEKTTIIKNAFPHISSLQITSICAATHNYHDLLSLLTQISSQLNKHSLPPNYSAQQQSTFSPKLLLQYKMKIQAHQEEMKKMALTYVRKKELDYVVNQKTTTIQLFDALDWMRQGKKISFPELDWNYLFQLYLQHMYINLETSNTKWLETLHDQLNWICFGYECNEMDNDIQSTLWEWAIWHFGGLYTQKKKFPANSKSPCSIPLNTFIPQLLQVSGISNTVEAMEYLQLIQEKNEPLFPTNYLQWDQKHLDTHNEKAHSYHIPSPTVESNLKHKELVIDLVAKQSFLEQRKQKRRKTENAS